MMEQVWLCTVCPMENWHGSSMNHIQGWLNDLNMLLSCFREKMPIYPQTCWNRSWQSYLEWQKVLRRLHLPVGPDEALWVELLWPVPQIITQSIINSLCLFWHLIVTVESGYSDTLWNRNFSRTVAGITKGFWVTIEGYLSYLLPKFEDLVSH